MMIQEEQAILDEQLESLYEATNVSQGNRDAWWQLWIAIGAIVIDVIVNINTFVLREINTLRYLYILYCYEICRGWVYSSHISRANIIRAFQRFE